MKKIGDIFCDFLVAIKVAKYEWDIKPEERHKYCKLTA